MLLWAGADPCTVAAQEAQAWLRWAKLQIFRSSSAAEGCQDGSLQNLLQGARDPSSGRSLDHAHLHPQEEAASLQEAESQTQPELTGSPGVSRYLPETAPLQDRLNVLRSPCVVECPLQEPRSGVEDRARTDCSLMRCAWQSTCAASQDLMSMLSFCEAQGTADLSTEIVVDPLTDGVRKAAVPTPFPWRVVSVVNSFLDVQELAAFRTSCSRNSETEALVDKMLALINPASPAVFRVFGQLQAGQFVNPQCRRMQAGLQGLACLLHARGMRRWWHVRAAAIEEVLQELVFKSMHHKSLRLVVLMFAERCFEAFYDLGDSKPRRLFVDGVLNILPICSPLEQIRACRCLAACEPQPVLKQKLLIVLEDLCTPRGPFHQSALKEELRREATETIGKWLLRPSWWWVERCRDAVSDRIASVVSEQIARR
ncbi:unnamed protein product [Symbiodinium sp. CCMP2592]|nr:unnamed protein product [Symbiodinium sp. CCMP2592]